MAEDTTLLNIEIGNLEESAKGFDDIIKFLEDAQKKMREFKKGETFVNAISGDKKAYAESKKAIQDFRKDIIQTVSKVRNELSQNALAMSVTKTETIETLDTMLEGFGKTASETGDKLEEAYIKARGGVELYQKELETLFTSTSKADDKLIKSVLNQQKSLKDIHKEQKDLLVENVEYQEQLALLSEAYNEAHDPELLETIKAKYDEVAQKLDANKKKLLEQRDLQRSALTATGKVSTTPGLENFADASRGLADLVGNVTRLTKTFGGADDESKNYNRTLSQLKESIEENKHSIQGFASTLTDSLLEAEIGFDRAAGAVKSMRKFSDNLSDISQTFQMMASRGSGLGRIPGLATSASTGMKGLSSGMSLLSKAAGPVLAGIEGIKLGFKVYDKIMGRDTETIEKRIEVLKKEAEMTRDLNELIREGSVERFEDRKREIAENVRDARRELEEMYQLASSSTSTFNQIRTIIGSEIFGDTKIYGAVGDEIDNLEDQIKDWEEQLGDLSEEGLSEAIERTKELNEQISEASRVLDNLDEQEKELTDLRYEAYMAQDEFLAEMTAAQEEFDAETKKLLIEREEEDYERLQKHLSEMEGLEEEFQKTVAEMRLSHLEELADEEQNFIKDIRESRAEHDEELREMEAEFREEEQEALEQYRLEELEEEERYRKTISQLEEDFNKDRLKAQRDLQEELFMAELENDALRFYQLRRQGEKEADEAKQQHKERLKEEEEGFKEGRKERAEDFKKEQQERKERYKEERAGAIKQFREEIRLKQEQHRESMQLLRDQHADELRQEQYAHQQAMADRAKRFQQEQRDLEKARAQEDLDREERLASRREEMHNAYGLELEYFRRREQLLSQYVSGLQVAESQRAGLRQAISDQQLSRGDVTAIMPYIEETLSELRQLESEGRISDDERALLYELQNVATLSAAQLQKVRDTPTEISTESVIAISDAIDRVFSEGVTEMRSEFEHAYQFRTTGEQLTYEGISEINVGESLATDLTEHMRGFFEYADLEFTDLGIQTEEGINKVEELQSTLAETRDVTLEELQTTVDEMNNFSIETWEKSKKRHDEAVQDEVERLSAYYDDSEGMSTEYYDTGINLASDFYKDDLAERERYLDDAIATSEERYGEQEELIRSTYDTQNEDTRERLDEQLNINRKFGQRLESDTERAYRDVGSTVAESNRNMVQTILNTWSSGSQTLASGMQSVLSNISSMIANVQSQAQRSSRTSITTPTRTTTPTTRSSGQTRTYSPYGTSGPMLAAAEGIFIDRPTPVLVGENKKPEVVLPLESSGGIPDDILLKMGEGIAGQLSKGGMADTLPLTAMESLLMKMSSGGGGVNMSNRFGDISIGGGVSRTELEDYFDEMMMAILEIFHGASMPN